MTDESGNGWDEWKRHILEENRRQNAELCEMRREMGSLKESMQEKIGELRAEIARLQIKSGLWGAAGAAIPVIIGIALNYLK